MKTVRLDVEKPVTCSFRFPFLVLYPERYTKRIKAADGFFYTPIEDYFYVVRDLGLAPKNAKNVTWRSGVIKALPVAELMEGVAYIFHVFNTYEYASLLYSLGSKLEWGRIVVITDYPPEVYESALGMFVTAKSDTITVVQLSDLFKAGKLGLETILPVYALVLDPSLRHARKVIEEVYAWFGASIVVDVYAPGRDLFHGMPVRASELAKVEPKTSAWILKREAALERFFTSQEVKAVIFNDAKVIV